ncbi:MAG: class I adenylate-forming enzyme family protein [Halobellus sp.]|uniref:class I adenylate-forming enzyme family protein n=1 Tax=Halobellus sp. TaxID=1979212 RepID=UPI0035D47213
MQDFTNDTIVWDDNVVTHRLDAFTGIEVTEHRGKTVRAFENRPESLFELFATAVSKTPEREFVVFPASDVRVTYREMADRVDQLADGLRSEGISMGDRIVFLLDSRLAFVESLLAAARIGAVVSPLNTRHSPEEIRDMFADGTPDLVLADEDYADKLEQSGYEPPHSKTVILEAGGAGQSYGGLMSHTRSDFDESATTPEDLLTVMYTSGTTGQPKAVPIDNFHGVNAALNNAYVHDIQQGSRLLVPSPLFHVTGLVCGLLTAIVVNGTGVIMREYGPQRFLRSIHSERVNYCMGVPTHIILAAEKADEEEYDASSLEKFAYGGAPMPPDAIPKIRSAFPNLKLYHSYGKTENFAGIAAMIPDRYIDANPEVVGMPTPTTKFAVVDEDRNRLPPGQIGELAMYGPFVAQRYLSSPEGTEEEFHEGWHFTGDIGVIDESGFIRLRGRKGNMMIRGGENVYPVEVEDALLSVPGVREAGVASFPDDVLGERIIAVVAPEEQHRVTEEMLIAACEEHLAEYKVPDIFRVVNELPRNQNGKLERQELVPKPLQFGIKFGG